MKALFITVSFVASVFVLSSEAADVGKNRLQLAMATCQVETVRQLLEAGTDPNAQDSQGQPIIRWLASNRKCNDENALATAKILDGHGATFQSYGERSGPSLLVNLATRHLPKTLAFLSQKKESGDPTLALKAIARSRDLESQQVLLAAGADPLAGPRLGSALFDAAASDQEPAVREMLKYVPDKQSPKVLAAYDIAKKQGRQRIARLFLDAGVKPFEPIKPRARFERHELTSAQADLLTQLGLPNNSHLLGLAGEAKCKFIQSCGDLILIDCNSAADGPAYYINQKTSELLATCGGACMKGCTGCPPAGWTCECQF